MKELQTGDVCYYMGVKHEVTSVIIEHKIEMAIDSTIINYIIAPFYVSGKIAHKYKIKVNKDNPLLQSSEDYENEKNAKIALKLALNSIYGKGSIDREKEIKRLEKVEDEYKSLIEIIKTLFQGRCKLYERIEYSETCNEEGSHAKKIATTSYILEFHNNDLHYEFHLHKDEFDRLKEVLL